MWNDEQKQRFQALRTCDRQQALSAVEKAEVARMIQELEDEEAAYLQPANQRLDAKIRQAQEQDRVLKSLARRQQTLIRRMERQIDASQREQQFIDGEVQRILAEQSPQAGAGV